MIPTLSSRLYRLFRRIVPQTGRFAAVSLLVMFLAGCAVYANKHLNDQYGEPQVRDRQIAVLTDEPEFHRDVKPIVDSRCVVCHACYDAPCQLKLSAFEGIERGVSSSIVYDGARLRTATPSRLFVDADSTEQWRDKGFYPVLNERQQSPQANLEGSSFYRMLAMKQAHPLPEGKLLPEDLLVPGSFDLSLNRSQQCASIEQFDFFEEIYPQWGMPYGLPAVAPEEFSTLKRWLEIGSPVKPLPPLSQPLLQQVESWENFLNGSSLKQKLTARYIYEHLFVANLHFPDVSTDPLKPPQYFKLVRSSSPSGQPVQTIVSRRPFDAPGRDNFYYRLVSVKTTITAKTHMPYWLDAARMQRWQALFLDPDYVVDYLPSYDVELASNPFVTFKQLPVGARYRFMLDEAQYTISGFIKGPVCRGQIALSVINDHFWVVFVNPDEAKLNEVSNFLASEADLFKLPAGEVEKLLPLSHWRNYSKRQQAYLSTRELQLKKLFPDGQQASLDMVWDGDGHNRNAALTVYRHNDSATVTKGLVGAQPKTGWLIGYTLLERIHYLLVSGFDVYGNVGHQLMTRLYMDFLRMEGEANLLELLPNDVAQRELEHWYRGAESEVKQYVDFLQDREESNYGITFTTEQPKHELFELISQRLGAKVVAPDPINRSITTVDPIIEQMQRLAQLQGTVLTSLPEQALLRVTRVGSPHRLFSLVRNVSHSNVSSLFAESYRLIDEEQTLTVVEGVVGAHPNVLISVAETLLPEFIDQFAAMDGEEDYQRLLDNYAVRRTDPDFWQFSDWLQGYYQQREPIVSGLLDYNRLENR
ncbi:MAG: fatty acid cis/trans isomerase [Motiliproteus sp.]